MDQSTVTTVKVRRHNSLPQRVKRYSPGTLSRMNQKMKFNPYVGWFRHSPSQQQQHCSVAVDHQTTPKTQRSATQLYFSTKKTAVQLSPYVGWFRHSPTLSAGLFYAALLEDTLYKAVEDELMLFLKAALPSGCHYQVCELADFLAGRLRGGNPRKEHNVQLWTSVARWILQPFFDGSLLENDDGSRSSLKSLENDSLTTIDDEDGGCSDSDSVDSEAGEEEHEEEFAPRHGGYRRSSSVESEEAARGAVSSQAEAWHAHQAAKELNPDEVSPSRLNHVVTQMDIIRMQRNASRHLDVESIYQLPTVTYRKNKGNRPNGEPPATVTRKGGSTNEAWSWMVISNQQDEEAYRRPSTSSSAGISILDGEEDSYQECSTKDDVCVICLEPFQYGDRLRVLPCNHSFHMGCIDRWLSGSASFDDCNTTGCPTCKKRPVAPPPPALPQSEAEESWVCETSNGNVPSWAFCQLGSALLARDSQMVE